MKMSSVIRQRVNLKTGVSRKQNTPNFLKNENFLLLIRIHTCAYQGVRNVCFSENLLCFVFLKHSFRDPPFSLITDEVSFYNVFSTCLCSLSTSQLSFFVGKLFEKNDDPLSKIQFPCSSFF